MSSPRRRVRWSYLGRFGYRRAVTLQERLREALRAGEGGEHLLLLEHDPVFTLGRNARRSDIVAGAGWLAERGVEVVECNRGGRVTYHGPGQLVGYPIVNLDPDRRDLRRYVRDLTEVLVAVLAVYGVAAEPGDGDRIGVWAGENRKIASLGVHVSRWLTTHGFSLNVATDLSLFGGIVPCGLPGVQMASIETETGLRPPLAEVAGVCAEHFGRVFDRIVTPVPAAALEPWPTAT